MLAETDLCRLFKKIQNPFSPPDPLKLSRNILSAVWPSKSKCRTVVGQRLECWGVALIPSPGRGQCLAFSDLPEVSSEVTQMESDSPVRHMTFPDFLLSISSSSSGFYVPTLMPVCVSDALFTFLQPPPPRQICRPACRCSFISRRPPPFPPALASLSVPSSCHCHARRKCDYPPISSLFILLFSVCVCVCVTPSNYPHLFPSS